MNTKTSYALFLGSMLLLATGCGKSKALMAAEEYEKAACACKTAACATEASQAYAGKAGDMASIKASEGDELSKATTNAASCVTKVSMAGIPGMPTAK